MYFTTSLAAFAATAAAVALPVEREAKTITTPLKLVSSVKNVKNLVARGQARLNHINGVSSKFDVDAASGSITNEDVTYVAPVVIGGSTYSLIVDTGCMYIV